MNIEGGGVNNELYIIVNSFACTCVCNPEYHSEVRLSIGTFSHSMF